MTKLTESAIEFFAIEQFEQLGHQYVYGCSIAVDLQDIDPEKDYSFSGFYLDGYI